MGSICSSYITNISTSSVNNESYSLYPSFENSKYLQLKHFHYLSTLGEGSFGKVILVRRKSNERLYAIKLINTDRLIDLRKREYAMFERQVLVEFQNPFIVKLHHIFESSGKLCFVLDFMQGGNLGFHLKRHNKFVNSVVAFFAAEVLVALEILHKREFIYRDLKPENILLDIDGHIKLADFNLSTTIEDLNDSICGSPEYAAPEVLSGEIQGIELDFWGFGVLLYHMLQGTTPFQANSYFDICKNILLSKYSFTSNFDKNAIDLISKLLVANPKERLTDHMAIKNHNFFADIDWASVEARNFESPIKLRVKNPLDLKYFPKKKYPPMIFSVQGELDVNQNDQSSYSQFSDFSYNSEIN